jgi:Cu(I)/Ag(I) efflux system membrane fusion protein
MTNTVSRLHASASGVLVAVAVLSVGLVLQHLRHGWPFSLHHGAAPTAATEVPRSRPSGPSVDRPAEERVAIDVDRSQVEQMGIRFEIVRGETMTQPVRAAATIVPDESRISHVHTRVAGWVEELSVNTTGQPVRAGEPLARIFSQELLASQTEYLAARRHAVEGPPSVVVDSGRMRLKVLGMTDSEVETIERTGEPMRLVTVIAPHSGVAVHRGISVGTAVDPSTELLTVADLSTVWVLAELPAASVSAVTVGTPARLEFPGSGRAAFTGRVAFIYPTLTERTRTVRARLTVANPGGVLRPGLYGTVELQTTARRVLTVPRDAVVDTGRTQHVFVATAAGPFEPRPVTLGARLAQRVEVLSGLSEGERIVASGTFLLDSESRLRASGAAGGHAHAATPSKQGDARPEATDSHVGHGK